MILHLISRIVQKSKKLKSINRPSRLMLALGFKPNHRLIVEEFGGPKPRAKPLIFDLSMFGLLVGAFNLRFFAPASRFRNNHSLPKISIVTAGSILTLMR